MKKNLTKIFDFSPAFFHICQWLIAGALAFAALWVTSLAWIYPLEFEARESTEWLYALAQQAGISLYDHSKVAFINMVHGPISPFLKYIFSVLFPFFSPAQIVRLPVLVLPWVLVFCSWKIQPKQQRRWLDAILWGLGLYFAMASIIQFNLLVGRSDPTATAFFAIYATILAPLLVSLRENEKAKINKRTPFFAGVFAALVFFTNWRMSTAVGMVFIGMLWTLWSFGGSKKKADLKKFLVFFSAGVGLVFVFVLGYLFHFDFEKYYKHFFGFYKAESGWGHGPSRSVKAYFGPLFSIQRQFLFAAVLFVAFLLQKHRADRRWKTIWFSLIAAELLVTAFAYYLNQGAGGLYYFNDFALVFWFGLFVCRAPSNELSSNILKSATVLWVLGFLCYKTVAPELRNMHRTFRPAQEFLAEVKRIDEKYRVFSEELFFYMTKYRGELIDMGDEIEMVTRSNYYGHDFVNTAKNHWQTFRIDPPEYALLGGISSYFVKSFVPEHYQPYKNSPPHMFFLGQEGSVLWKRTK